MESKLEIMMFKILDELFGNLECSEQNRSSYKQLFYPKDNPKNVKIVILKLFYNEYDIYFLEKDFEHFRGLFNINCEKELNSILKKWVNINLKIDSNYFHTFESPSTFYTDLPL